MLIKVEIADEKHRAKIVVAFPCFLKVLDSLLHCNSPLLLFGRIQ